MTTPATWYETHSSGAPDALRTRGAEFIARTGTGSGLASRLTEAASLSLASVLRQGRDRSAALDLLTADGLLTLAMLAQAEESPETLGQFAADIVNAASA